MSKISNIQNRYKDVKIENGSIGIRLYRWTEEEFFEYAEFADAVNKGEKSKSEMLREMTYKILKKDDSTTTREDVKNVNVFDKNTLMEEQMKMSGMDTSEFEDEKKKAFTPKKVLNTSERTLNLRNAVSNL